MINQEFGTDKPKNPIYIGPQRNLVRCKAQILLHNLKLISKKDTALLGNITLLENDIKDIKTLNNKLSYHCEKNKHVLSINKDLIGKNKHEYADTIYFPEGCGENWSLEKNKQFINDSIKERRTAILLTDIQEEISTDDFKKGKSVTADEIFWLKDSGYNYSNTKDKDGVIIAIPPENKNTNSCLLQYNSNVVANRKKKLEQLKEELENSPLPQVNQHCALHLNGYIEKFKPGHRDQNKDWKEYQSITSTSNLSKPNENKATEKDTLLLTEKQTNENKLENFEQKKPQKSNKFTEFCKDLLYYATCCCCTFKCKKREQHDYDSQYTNLNKKSN